MKRITNTLPIAALILMTACVSESQLTWKPLVDTANDPNVGTLTIDYAECQRLALHAPENSGGGFGQSTPEADEAFKRIYIDCMKQRGHPIITVNPAQIPAPAVFAPPGMKMH